jgi:hypothetical protein
VTAADIRRIAIALADELEARARSGRGSSSGIGALVEGDDQWTKNRRNESMDPTNTGTDTESSYERLAAADLEALRRSPRPRGTPKPRAGRRAARSP